MTPSAFDAFLDGDKSVLTDPELEGLQSFIETGCITCHAGPGVGGGTFRKLGLVKAYGTEDPGRFAVTGKETDRNVFKVPSLRNVAQTAPYFHDGSIESLDEAIRIMAEHQLGVELSADRARLIKVLPQIRNKVMDVFKPYPPGADTDPDQMIYSGGFFSNTDRRLMDKIRNTAPDKLTQLSWPFKDSRLKEMLFRYRARNFPATLSSSESRLWQTQRLARLNRPTDERQLDPESFRMEISAARQSHAADSKALKILDQLEAWGNEVCNVD